MAFGGMMRKLFWLLYTGLVFGANAAGAGVIDPALLTGEMGKLVVEEARPVPEASLLDMAGSSRSLTEFHGKWVVLNFWATWCVPCRTEMPSLDRLQVAMPDIAVVTVATGPNPTPAIEKFMGEAGVVSVAVLRDPDSRFAHAMGIMGLPVTVIVSPEGEAVARLIGGAEWDGIAAQGVLAALMAP
jgi:thiol-disulfide isomerase/thioredoxin